MILVIGGAYNGKLQFVKEKFNICDYEIYTCNGQPIDLSKKVINGIHKYTLKNVRENMDSVKWFQDNLHILEDKIIICDEINCGIVPINKEERIWREETGKVLQLLSKKANIVYRVFCGIEMELKNE